MGKRRASSPRHAKDYIEVAGVLGEAMTRRLSEFIGGVRTYIPLVIPDDDIIVTAIGRDAANTLSEYFHARPIELPRIYLNRERVVQMKQEHPSMSSRDIALATGYSDRHVRHILADHHEDDKPQFTFPGF